jgi:O-methyltransferase involved in polyketide biosynthesis
LFNKSANGELVPAKQLIKGILVYLEAKAVAKFLEDIMRLINRDTAIFETYLASVSQQFW